MLSKVRSTLIICATLIAWLSIVQILFLQFQNESAKKSRAAALGVLRTESSAGNPFLLSKAILDLEHIGLMNCTVLTDPQGQVYLDTKYKGNCNTTSWLLDGQLIHSTLQSLNGQSWNLSFLSQNTFYFYLSLWLTRLFGVVAIIYSFSFLKTKIVQAESLVQLERDARTEVEKRTKQVKHDLASPLTALKIACSQMRIDHKTKDFFIQIVSRVESIYSDLENSPHQILDTEEFFCPHAVALQVSKEKQDPRILVSGTSESIRGPKSIFERALSNLLNNSLQASPRGRISVVTSVHKNSVSIQIEDTGPGFPKEILDEIRWGKTINKSGGSGLGLYQAKNAVNELGGNFKIMNSETGAVISIELPTT